MKYRHYSPEASLILYRGTPSATANCIASHADRPDVAIVSHTPVATGAAKHVRLSPDPAEAAPRLFATLRAVDTPATREIHVQGYPATGVGAAIMNRLEKAAGQIVDA
jgi:L-threonylcarbamoyladenylate synthase